MKGRSGNSILAGAALLVVLTAGTARPGSNTNLGDFSNGASGSFNTALGYATLENNIDGNNNVAVGADALNGNTHGSDNTAMGVNALISNTTGGEITGIGRA